ncbi:hypothetical protein TNCV_1933461 [Trichonephila clavipes]|nr:hypothetical protein TNCV_1933461 [Trichonephila clavipes]
MSLTKKYLSKPVVWQPSLAYALVINTEAELGFIAEDHTPPVVMHQLQEVGKYPVNTAYDAGLLEGILMFVSFLYVLHAVIYPSYHWLSERW